MPSRGSCCRLYGLPDMRTSPSSTAGDRPLGVLQPGWQREIVARNVALMVEPPSAAEGEIEPFTQAEARALLAEAADRRNGARWSVALAEGLRQGEALGLRWKYVDLDAGVMKIWWQLQRLTWQHGCEDPHICGAKHHRKACKASCTAYTKLKNGCPKPCPKGCTGHAKACPERTGGGLVFREPKGKNKRLAPIPPPLVPLLKAHRKDQVRERLAAGRGAVGGTRPRVLPAQRPADRPAHGLGGVQGHPRRGGPAGRAGARQPAHGRDAAD